MSLDITITTSRHFLGWLAAEGISLAFTTYQNNRLFLLGLKDDHTLSTYERLFDRPMGLYVAGSHLYLSTRTQLWQLENALPPGTLHEGYDALYVPRKSHVTGDLDVHDCAIDHQGRLVFANTLYSCLATTSTEYSFSVLWKPPFISKLVAEDRCHLNGLAMDNGVPRYVTTISRSDVASGWRQRRNNGGCLIDIQSNQIIQNQLSMPHSPRVHEGKIWILNSGSGEIGYVDNHGFSPVVFCPGYLRGMTLYKNFAIVGLSKPRYNKAFTGLTLDQQLQDKDAEAFCGLYIIDLQRGEIAHWVQLEGIITELYDVGVLQGVRRPQALGFRSDEIERYITFEAEQKLYFHPLSGNNRDDFSEGAGIDKRARDFSLPPMRSAQEITPPPAKQMPPQKARAKSTASLPHNYRFQVAFDMNLEMAIQQFNGLTYPNLQQEAQRKRFYEPLIAVVAQHNGQNIGMALAEYRRPDNPGALLRSLFVAPAHREKGIAKSMMQHLEQALKKIGISTLDWVYRTDWTSLAIIEKFMLTNDWLPAQSTLHQYRLNAKKLLATEAFKQPKLADGYSIFSWAQLTASQRAEIIAKAEYPANLDPFQIESLQAENSYGLKKNEKVIGWMITHRSNAETIQYTSLFLSNSERKQFNTIPKKVMPLIKAAVYHQATQNIPLIIFQVEAKNQEMQKFTARFLAPAIVKSSEVRITQKRVR